MAFPRGSVVLCGRVFIPIPGVSIMIPAGGSETFSGGSLYLFIGGLLRPFGGFLDLFVGVTPGLAEGW